MKTQFCSVILLGFLCILSGCVASSTVTSDSVGVGISSPYSTSVISPDSGEVIRNVPKCKPGQTKDCFRPLTLNECTKLEDQKQRELCELLNAPR